MRRQALLLVCLAVLSVASGCGAGAPAGRTGHGVLVLAIDGLRADHLRCLGYDRETTPHLDRIAREGAVFARTVSAAPRRLPAHFALLTGQWPETAQRIADIQEADERRWSVPAGASRVAVEFLASGYRTAFFADHADLSPVYGIRAGFERFSAFDPALTWSPPEETGLHRIGPSFRAWLQERRRDDNWFAYVHLHDLERAWRFPNARRDAGFRPREGLDFAPPIGHTEPIFHAVPRSHWHGGARTIGEYRARYDGALRDLDDRVAHLRGDLERAGRWEDTTVCIVGTHGVQFGESGLIIDNGMLSVADVHVPWILKPAEGRGFELGQVIEHVASTIDVGPTLLELSDLPLSRRMHGRSQVGVLRGDEEPVREWAFTSCGLVRGFGVYGDRWAWELMTPWMAADRSLVQSWYGDTAEHHDLFERFYDWTAVPFPPLDREHSLPADVTAELRAAGSGWQKRVELLRRIQQFDVWESAEGLTPDEREELSSHGYLSDAAP